MSRSFHRPIAAGLVVVAAALFAPPARAATVYVTVDGIGDGSSWGSASSLTNALATATNGSQLWIAEGTYTNTANPAFQVTNGLTLYGGFTNGMATLGERDWANHPALLDGEATRRVLEISAGDVVLDGLVVTNAYHNDEGCGLRADAGVTSLTLANCLFTHNESSASHTYGGGAAFFNCPVTMSNCVFDGNLTAIPPSIWYQGGGGFYANGADLVIVDCLFTNNGNDHINSRDSIMGGGFYMTGGSLAATNTTFVDNKFYGAWSPGDGGGAGRLVNVAPARFDHCLFLRNRITPTGNNRDGSGGALTIEGGGAAVAIENCLFVSNYTTFVESHGGALYVEAGTVGVTNCTFAYNSTDYQGGAIHVGGGAVSVKNCILWTNTANTRGADISFVGGTLTVDHCLLSGDPEDSAYVYDETASLVQSSLGSEDPLFASGTDFHVKSPAGRWNGATFVSSDPQPYSPAIDAGDPATSVGDEVADHGSRVNLGRYGGTAEASKSPAVAPVVETRTVTTNVNVAILRGELVTATTIAEARIYYSTNAAPTNTDAFAAVYPPQQTGTVFSATVGGLLYATTYYYRAFASNAYGVAWASAISNFTTGAEPPGGGPTILHVKADAVGGETGENWFNAFTSLSDAAAAVNAGTNEIWVAGGTYNDATVDIGATASVYGGFDGTETNRNERDVDANPPAIVDGDAVRRGIHVTAGTVILDGLTVSNARHNAHGCGLRADAGVDGLQVVDCLFTHNESSASYIYGGGAAFFNCPVTMSNCVFDGNLTAIPPSIWYQGGGGFYASGADVVVVDCLFTNNGNDHINSRDSIMGAGFYAAGGSLAVTNTTFVDNKFYGAWQPGDGGGAGRINGVAAARFDSCLFLRNRITPNAHTRDCSGGALAIEGGSSGVAIENCLFVSNYTTYVESHGGALYVEAGTVGVTNCTFAYNWTDYQGGAIHVAGGNLEVRNSIFHTNSAAVRGNDVSLFPSGSATISYCRAGGDEGSAWIYDGEAGIVTDHIITVDPKFASATDFHVKSRAGRWDPVTMAFTNDTEDSLCIDSGDPASAYANESVTNGGLINLGRYGNTAEASKTFTAAPMVTNVSYALTNNYVTLEGILAGNDAKATVGFYYGLADGDNDFALWDDFLDVPGQWPLGTNFSGAVGDLLYNTTYYARAFATNSLGHDFADDVMSFTTGAEPPGGPATVLHVKNGAPGSRSGVTWFDACHSVVEALALVSGTTNEIWVAGVAQTAATVRIATDVSVYGGFVGTETTRSQRDVGANETLVDGEGVREAVRITGGTVTLDGLTISNGVETVGCGIYASGYTAITLANCHVVANQKKTGTSGTHGYGAYFSGGLVFITNTVFANNNGDVTGGSTGYGAGISANGVNLLIVDSSFVSNSLQHFDNRDGPGGGAMYANGGTLTATNVLFLGNRSGAGSTPSPTIKGGGALHLAGNLTARFKNCAFASNDCIYPADPARNPAGGTMHIAISAANTVTVENCSIAYGEAQGNGGAIHVRSGRLEMKNSILWTNVTGDTGHELYVVNASSVASNWYCMLTGTGAAHVATANGGTVDWGPGITTNDPVFASVFDLHLKSGGGRYDPAVGTFVRDSESSPAINAGDPTDPIADETQPHGNRINLGAYGGTFQASRSPSFGTVVLFR